MFKNADYKNKSEGSTKLENESKMYYFVVYFNPILNPKPYLQRQIRANQALGSVYVGDDKRWYFGKKMWSFIFFKKHVFFTLFHMLASVQ